MKAMILAAAVLLTMATQAGARTASRDCGIRHRECYPACIRMAADGSDCEKTTEVCRDTCVASPAYPSVSTTDRIDAVRPETPVPAAAREKLGPDTAPE
jgi:hypothetical protein